MGGDFNKNIILNRYKIKRGLHSSHRGVNLYVTFIILLLILNGGSRDILENGGGGTGCPLPSGD